MFKYFSINFIINITSYSFKSFSFDFTISFNSALTYSLDFKINLIHQIKIITLCLMVYMFYDLLLMNQLPLM